MPYAIRSLLKAPAYSTLVVLTLALGIGATTAIFCVFRGVLLKPLPHADGDRTVYLQHGAARAGLDDVKFSVPEVIDFRESVSSLTGFGEFSAMPFTMLGAGRPTQVETGIVSANYFEVVGLEPVLGRVLASSDDGEAADPVMVLTFEYWQRAFGADPGVLGRVVEMNGRSVTIVGVVEPAPPFPGRTDVFVNIVTSPHHMDATMVHGRSHRMTDVFARLVPGAEIETVRTEIDAVSTRMYADWPEHYDAAAGYEVSVVPLRDALVSEARLTLYLLMAAAGLVLLTACANAANLVLTRNLRRDREFAVRWSLGADRASLRRILLAETGVLAAVGAVLGLGLAYLGLDLLVGFAERYTTRASEIRMDPVVLVFTALVGTAAAFAFAFAPALNAHEADGASLTRSGTRTTGGGRRLQRGLIVAQVAASVTVLAAAGLLGRTLLTLNAVDPGLDVANTLTLEAPASDDGANPVDVMNLQEQMRRRIAELPGIQEVGLGLSVPLRSNMIMLEVKAEGRPNEPGRPVPMAEYRTATPDFFDAAGMRLLSGRAFQETDQEDTAPVAIVNEALAQRLFGDDDPIGQRIAWTGQVLSAIGMTEEWRTIVGVVANTLDHGPTMAAPPVMFRPFAQSEMPYFPGAFVVRGEQAEALAPEVQRIINEMAPETPVLRVATLEQVRQDTIAAERLNTFLVAVLGDLALVIASVGLAGVLSFLVSERTSEIGIRMSLGAAPRQVLSMVLLDGGRLLAAGTLLGIVASFGVTRLLEGLLFGVTPGDPRTMALVVVVMTAVGLAAAAGPAMRAARIDPLDAIRQEEPGAHSLGRIRRLERVGRLRRAPPRARRDPRPDPRRRLRGVLPQRLPGRERLDDRRAGRGHEGRALPPLLGQGRTRLRGRRGGHPGADPRSVPRAARRGRRRPPRRAAGRAPTTTGRVLRDGHRIRLPAQQPHAGDVAARRGLPHARRRGARDVDGGVRRGAAPGPGPGLRASRYRHAPGSRLRRGRHRGLLRHGQERGQCRAAAGQSGDARRLPGDAPAGRLTTETLRSPRLRQRAKIPAPLRT